MAKIKLGAIVVDMRGKSNGHVFARNRGGAYMRTKVSPLNPQSTAQSIVRGLFANITRTWSGLDQQARNTWNSRVADYATTDVFGDIRNPSGKALFQKLNQNLAISGQAALNECPEPTDVPFVNITSAAGDVSSNLFDVQTIGNTTGSRIVIWATPPQTQGTKFVKNKLRQLLVVDGENETSISIYAAYTAKYGALTAGMNIVIGARTINANGQASPLETVKALIEA